MKFSFVIPNYRKPELLDHCLFNLRKFYPNNEVIVVDDASPEIETIAMVCFNHGCILKKSYRNNGFGYNCNRGIEASRSDAVVLVNSDVVLTEDVLQETELVLKDPKVGIVGYLLYYPEGNIQHGGHHFNSFLDISHVDHHKSPSDANGAYKSRYIMSVTGALMTIRKSMVDDIGGFGKDYSMSFEDVELCLRAWNANWRVYYSAKVSAIHAEGVCRGKTIEEKKAKGSWEAESESLKTYIKDIQGFSFADTLNKVRQCN